MYLERKVSPEGKYRYLVKCKDCNETRWVSDAKSSGKRCRSCAKKARVFNFCRVWPCNCKYCNKAIMLKSRPQIDGVSTCLVCKGRYGGRQMSEENKLKLLEKPSRECSECNKRFIPLRLQIKTCSKVCSIKRKKRLQQDYHAKHKVINKKSRVRDFDGNIIDKKQISKIKEKIFKTQKVLPTVDENGKPKYVRRRDHQKVIFKEHKKSGLTDNEISEALIKKFIKNGGEASVKFKKEKDNTKEDGQTWSFRKE